MFEFDLNWAFYIGNVVMTYKLNFLQMFYNAHNLNKCKVSPIKYCLFNCISKINMSIMLILKFVNLMMSTFFKVINI